jgi:hypothetical protein
MIPLLIPALGSGAVILAANLSPEETDNRAPVKVPIVGVSANAWVGFVKLNVGPNVVTRHYRYGAFGFTVRRLVDLGAMKNPRSIRQPGGVQKGGPSIVWAADWINPSSLQAFLREPMEQYRLFAESMRLYSEEAVIKAAVGQTVDGKTVTLSGALELAHRGGLPGIQSWLQDPKERKQFRWTTEAFEAVNGLF